MKMNKIWNKQLRNLKNPKNSKLKQRKTKIKNATVWFNCTIMIIITILFPNLSITREQSSFLQTLEVEVLTLRSRTKEFSSMEGFM